MTQFLEERLPVCIKYGGSFSENHNVSVVTTAGGNEYRSLRHPYVVLSYDVSYEKKADFIREQVISLYSRANGTFRGFRVKDLKDFTTNNYVNAPTALDQPMVLVNPTVPTAYQLMRWYGNPADPICARRRIRKPVAGTVLVGVAGAGYPAAQWSVDDTTGLVTLAANKSRAITAITQASSAVLTVGSHTFVVGNSVAISGVAGMTQINGLRALVTAIGATTITVAINSAAFSAYTNGGTVQTQPITGEAVTAGCEFDIPCRFNSDLSGSFTNLNTLDAGFAILEVLNP